MGFQRVRDHLTTGSTWLLLTTAAFMPQAALADLTGLTVTGTLETQAAGGFPEPVAVVGDGLEFRRTFFNGDITFDIDIDVDTLTIIYTNNLAGSPPCPDSNPTCLFNMGLQAIEISDLPGAVEGFELEASDWPPGIIADTSFGDGFVRVDFLDNAQIPGFGTVWTARFKILQGAVITYSPRQVLNDESSSNPIEGDFVFFSCANSTDYDPDNMVCRWDAAVASLGDESGPAIQQAEGQNVIYAFPQNEIVPMTLTLIDTANGTSEQTTRNVVIDNGDPLINAIDVEVVAGREAEAICRFADPGVFDSHSVFFDLPAGITDVDDVKVSQEFEPSLSSGFGTVRFVADVAPGQYSATCTVNDDGSSIAQSFTISVISEAELAAREAGNPGSTDGAPVIVAGAEVLGLLDSPTDIDVFELQVPVEDPNDPGLKVGGEFVVNLRVPTDYDLIILSSSTSDTASTSPFVNAPFVNAPFVNAPFVNVPFVNVPFVNAPFVNAPFVNVPFVNAPFVNAPFVNAPFVNVPLTGSPFLAAGFEFTDFPLSQVGLAAPDGGQVSGIDIALDELGSANLGNLLDESLQVQVFSAEPGSAPERVLLRVGPGVERLYAAVVSNSGSFVAAPYSLRVEASSPPSQEQLIGAQCFRDPLVDPDIATQEVEELFSPAGPVKTLIVTQRERFRTTHGLTGAEFDNNFLGAPAMQAYLNDPAVAARVVSVPSVWFDDADANQCRVDLQNAVAALIREEVLAQLASAGPGIEHVMLMGGPDIVPPFYTPDETTVGYEGLYVSDLLVEPGRPIAVAYAEGNNITDAPYGDLDPLTWRGRELYLEDLSVSRLVETPAEILAAVAAFGNGEIVINGTLTTGYDFFADGAAETAAVLATISPGNTTEQLISDAWSGNELRCSYLAETDGVQACPVLPSVSAVNFHATYNAGLSAAGFQNFPANASGTEILQALESKLGQASGLTLSLGCHTALSVPDAWALPSNIGLPLDPGKDWVQQPGNWIGSWNYALGDNTVASRGTEGLITLVAEELANGLSLGSALVRAKQRYAVGAFEFDVHDEKSLTGLALFGLPQLRLAVPVDPPAPDLPLPGAPDPDGDALAVAVDDTISPSSQVIDYREVDTTDGDDNGVYFALGREAQAVVGRPLLPTVQLIKAQQVARTERLHDVVVTGGSFKDLTGVDPVFAFPQHDWVDTVEPQACVETFSPSQLGIATGVNLPGGPVPQALESLIVLGAQFKCTTPSGQSPDGKVKGTLRKYTGLNVEAQRPFTGPSDDFVPPKVVKQRLTASPASNDVNAEIEVIDNFDMREVVVLIYNSPSAGLMESQRFPLVNGQSSIVVADAKGKPLGFQYVDNSGNVLLKTGKGQLLLALEVDIVSNDIVTGPATEIVISFPGAANLAAAELTVDFGDGSFGGFPLFDAAGQPLPNVNLDGAGNATVTVTHDYRSYVEPFVDVSVTARGSGAEGSTSKTLGVTLFAIEDLDARPKSGKIQLTWTAVSAAVGYDIYRKTNNGPFELIADDHFSTYATYLDSDVSSGNTYTYFVVWDGGAGIESPESNEAVVVLAGGRRGR